MLKVECFGEICPIPLLKLKKSLSQIEVGDSVMLVVDHSCVVEAVRDYYKKSMHDITIDEVINGVWEITVIKS